MYMTAQLFHAAFAVLLVAVVVVFQEDLRRLFERVATLGKLRGRSAPRGLRHLDILVEVMAEFATRRIGALVVIRGLEPLDRHIDGGAVVDGQISKPLLESIFDPHSAGHDGAAILEGDRLRRFGVHLPLSHNRGELAARGTRHSAAVGLSERCDALAIIVSEERGAISVARYGKLTQLQSAADLQQVLDQFSRETFPHPSQSLLGRLVRENGALKAVSLAVACAAWLVAVYGSETVQRKETLAIEYRNPTGGLVIDENAPRQAVVTFSGLKQAFSLTDLSKLKISLDLSRMPEGTHKIPIDDDNIATPADIKVEKIDPELVTVRLRAEVNLDLPVEVQTFNRPPAGLAVASITTTPATVRVRLWRSQALATRSVFTEPVDLSQLTETTTLSKPLSLPAEPGRVMVKIEIVPTPK
jgi:DNA integrity scanning protein DisA with diadenylate cyclase activity